MRTKCDDCKGKGKWLGLKHFHDCETCEGTGWIGEKENDEDEEDDEEEDDDRFCIAHSHRPFVASGFTHAICAGGDEETEETQLAFSFFT